MSTKFETQAVLGCGERESLKCCTLNMCVCVCVCVCICVLAPEREGGGTTSLFKQVAIYDNDVKEKGV